MTDINKTLSETAKNNGLESSALHFPNIKLSPESIKVIMISEVPPQNPEDCFYSQAPNPDYMKTTLDLFNKGGVSVQSINDIVNMGIYITTAVKIPKITYTVESDVIEKHLPLLETELGLFPNLKVIMLMGDVAKKAVNTIVKSRTKKNVIPSGATYKLRVNEFFWNDIRVFPSYIITGGNILIEKSKCEMIADDIRRMMDFIKE